MSPYPFGFVPFVLPDCPTCNNAVFVEQISDPDKVVRSGLYVCGKCGSSFVKGGDNNDSELPKRVEYHVNPVDSVDHSDDLDAPVIFGEVTEE